MKNEWVLSKSISLNRIIMKTTQVFWLAIYLIVSTTLCGQNVIKGTIKNKANEPLSGAHVKYGNQQTTTNNEGKFSITCEENHEVKITYVGYETILKSVDCGSTLNVTMQSKDINLEGVDIKAVHHEEEPLIKAPQAIAELDQEQLHRNSGIYLEQSLNLEPGIRMEKRTNSGGQRITIRGYGNNTNFNGLGYKLYYDGIPITDAEGVTIMDALDFSNLGQAQVYKGPNSSRFGTGIAGVVNLQTKRPTPNQTSIGQEVIGGSYGLLRTNSFIETANDKSALRINYGHQSFDGYRTHTGSKKDYASIYANYHPNEKQFIEANFSYSNSYERLAGQLDSASFFTRRDVAETPYVLNDGHVAIENLRASLSHTYKISKHVSNTTRAFVNGYTLNQTYAVGLNDDHSLSFGGRTFFDFNFFKGKKVSLDGKVGGEYLKTTAKKSSNAMFGGVLGGFNSQNSIQAQRYFVFTEWQLNLPYGIKFLAGGSYNFIEYQVTDLLANASNPNHDDASGYKRFKPVFTPRLSLQKMWDDKYNVYISYSQGYMAPGSSDAVIPYTGEVNYNLSPETARQYEIGTKGSVLNHKLNYEVAAFLLQVDNKLNSKSVIDSSGTVLYTYTVNGGSQNNLGVEGAISYAIIKDNNKTLSLLKPYVNFTYSNFKYDDFKSDANDDANTVDYSGNTVIGVPPLLINGGIDLAFNFGVYLKSSVQYVDKMPITYNNQHHAPSYTLVNGKIGYKKEWEHFHLDVFFGVNNITNSLYYNMVFINWERGPNPSIYSPAAPNPTAFGGVSLKYIF